MSGCGGCTVGNAFNPGGHYVGVRINENEDGRVVFCDAQGTNLAKGQRLVVVIRTEESFDGRKYTVYYTSESRIDYRKLVADLALNYPLRIEMRQIGPRDETKIRGGLGPCGLTLCCSTFLKGFHPVTIKMAKNQNLSLNPSKISGMCGRLMCCLAYEDEGGKPGADYASGSPKPQNISPEAAV